MKCCFCAGRNQALQAEVGHMKDREIMAQNETQQLQHMVVTLEKVWKSQLS